LKPKTEASILQTSEPWEEAIVRGYVVVFEGDEQAGYSAYSPDLPGVVAAGDTLVTPGRKPND